MYDCNRPTIINTNSINAEKQLRARLGLKTRHIEEYTPIWIGTKSPMVERIEKTYKRHLPWLSLIGITIIFIAGSWNW